MLHRKINRKYIIQTRIGNSPTSRSVMFFFRTMSKMIFCCREGGTRNKTVYSVYFARRSLISNSPGYRYWTFKTTSPGSAFGGMAAFGASSASLIVMLGGQLGLYSLSSNVFFPLSALISQAGKMKSNAASNRDVCAKYLSRRRVDSSDVLFKFTAI